MKKLLITLIYMIFVMGGISRAGNYTSEQQEAYDYAYSQNITTISSIEKVNMNGKLTRIAMAKMISNFAINVLGLQPDTSKDCSFLDVSNSLDIQYNYGVTQACQLGLMGMGSDGKKSDNFNPYVVVTRAQFATAFSRAISQIYGKIMEDGTPYYATHLQYLQSKGIIKDVVNPSPTSVERRGNVMIMMHRAFNVIGAEFIDINAQNEILGLKKYGTYNTYAYWPDGTIQNAAFYDNNGNLNGDYISFYENGQIEERGQYKNNKKTGEWIEYFENGEIKSKGSFKNGKMDGYWEWYCEKGDKNCISTNGNYKDGERVWGVEQYGTYNTYAYWSDGTIQNAAFYDNNGNLNGDYISFYENGQIKEKGQYKNNKKTGEWIEYYEDGEIKSKGSFKDGKMDGDWEWYCKKGDKNCISTNGSNYIKLEKVKATQSTDLTIKISNKSDGNIRITGIKLGNYKVNNSANVYFGDNTVDDILKDRDDTATIKFSYPIDIEVGDSHTLTVRANILGTKVTIDSISFKIEEDNFGEDYEVTKGDSSVADWENLFAEN